MDRQGSGIRRLTGLLLAMNIGVLVTGLGVAIWPEGDKGGRSINSDKIRLLGLAESSRPNEVASGPSGLLPTAPVDAAVPPEVPACLAWKTMDQPAYERLLGFLEQQGLSDESYEVHLSKPQGWWVFIPPAADAANAKKALKEINAKKIKRAQIVRAGEMQHALALGTFPERGKALAYVRALAAKGIKGVQYGPRPLGASAVLDFAHPPKVAVMARISQAAGAEMLAKEACTSFKH